MNVINTVTVNQTPITYTKRNTAEQKSNDGSSKTDTLTLTEEARKFLETQKELENNSSKTKKDESESDMQRFIDALNNNDENESGSSIMDEAKCMKIARRILNGDKVPMKDRKFLAEKNRKLYEMALTFQKHNLEPKKYKTVLDENDEKSVESEGQFVEVSGAGEGISAEVLAEGLGE